MKKFLKGNITNFSSHFFAITGYYFIITRNMGKNMLQVARHPLISGSGIIFFGSLFGNFFNFLFNIFMSRNLSFSDYGTLASLSSLTTLFGFPVGSIIPTIVFFSATYFAANNLAMVRGLYIKTTKIFFIFGVLILMGSFFYNKALGIFFHISQANFLILAGFGIFLSFIGAANFPLLQAKLAFGKMTFINVLGSFLKLLFGVCAVVFGFAVGGVLWALIIATIIPYIASFTYLPFLFKKNTTSPDISLKTMFSYGAPAAIATFGLISLTTVDIVLVKHFFSPVDAGIYATLSLIGKVIYYFSAPIGSVMFPLITQKHTKGEAYHNDLMLALAFVFLSSISILVFYILFPSFVVSIFSPKIVSSQFISLIIYFGIFTSIYGLLSVLTNFYLSINKTNIFIPISLFAVGQVLILWFFHQTFFQVILISIVVAGLLLVILLLYYWRLYGKNRKK